MLSRAAFTHHSLRQVINSGATNQLTERVGTKPNRGRCCRPHMQNFVYRHYRLSCKILIAGYTFHRIPRNLYTDNLLVQEHFALAWHPETPRSRTWCQPPPILARVSRYLRFKLHTRVLRMSTLAF
jgi:hypothetical protein